MNAAGKMRGSLLSLTAEASNRPQMIVLVGALVLLALYFLSRENYLLFHSFAELFAVVVASSIFVLVWNTRRSIDSEYLLFLGIAYLFVALGDLLHTLAYTGMGVFQGHGTNLPTQLWIIARYAESVSLLIAPFLIGRRVNVGLVFLAYVIVGSLLLTTVFAWSTFPASFVEGSGLTQFKKTSEYVICLILTVAGYLLFRKRSEFDTAVFRLLFASILLTIASELSFTFYTDPFALPNLVGHYLKIVSFYLIYRAIVETGLVRPYSLLYRNLRKSEEAWRESEAKYRTLVESANDGIVIVQDGLIRYANTMAAATVGYGADEVVGTRIEEYVQADHLPETMAKYNMRAKGQDVDSRFDGAVVHRDGSSISVEATAAKITYRGRLADLIVMRDITRRKKTEEVLRRSEEQVRMLLDSTAEGVFGLDLAGICTFVNPSCVRLLGYASTDQLVGQEMHRLIHHSRSDGARHPREECRVNLSFLHGERIHVDDEVFWRADGTCFEAEYWSNPILRDGQVTGAVVTFLDITDRRKLEKLKDEFIGLVSHELRSPLTVVIGAVHTALSEIDRLSASETRQLLEDAASEADALSYLLGNLLELTRAQADRMVLYVELLSLEAVIKNVIETVSLQHPEHEFRAEVSRDLPMIEADQTRLERILYNLLDNAAKYSSPGSVVLILVLEKEESLVVSVRDQGPGLSATDKSRLFQPFERLDARGKGRGIGLGLVVCRRLVEAHGGEIWLESELGHGTTFHFTIPRARRQA